jgi:hypothetical protein
LTGERLAKEVPENHNRAGSIYADEFLTDYCPPDFDDLQRRQFFCILDLRRLKYAADEVFAKKDWKISILNFAKEYEKSRSLIMLRYGLYEFKTVKVSETIRKQWQKEHGIASSDDEKDLVPADKPNGTYDILGRGRSKRKATEELNPRDTLLTKSATNLNKRRATDREPLAEATPPTTNKTKRKADILSDPDENQPSKLQKSTADSQQASSVKSIFEKIANGARNESAGALGTPSKLSRGTTSDSVLGRAPTSSSAVKPVNGGLGRSVLDPSFKPAMTNNNIFGHLSDASKGSGNDDADAESEPSTESDAEADEESEVQDAGQSNEPSVAASGGTSTPQFGAGAGGLFAKKALDNAPSSTSSDTGDSTKGRSLFDRLTFGNDGQPVRMLPPGSEKPETSPEPPRSESPVRDSSGPPSNNTWNTDTPIKFAPTAPPASSLLGSAATKPGSLFAPKETPAPAPAVDSETPAAPAPTKEAAAPAALAPSSATSQPFSAKSPFSSAATSAFNVAKPQASDTAASLFGAAKPQASDTPASLFGVAKPQATDASASPFGAPKPQAAGAGASLFSPSAVGFGQPKPTAEKKEDTAPTPATGTSALFGAGPKAPEPETSKPAPIFQSSTLFGNATPANGTKPSPSTQQTSSLFGAAATKSPEPSAPETQTPSIFANATPKPANGLFGSSTTPSTTTAEPAKSLFGATNDKPASLLFGANAAPKPTPTPEPKTVFGGASAAPTPKPIFGGISTSQDESVKPQTSIFANPTGGSTLAPTGNNTFSFGSSRDTTPVPQFGAGASQQNAAQPGASSFGGGATGSSFSFTAGGGQQSSFNNPFASNGGASGAPSFNFGANNSTAETGGQGSSFVFGGTTPSFGGATPAPSISFGAGSGASTPATQPGNSFGGAANGGGSGASPFTFGANSSQASATPIFSQQSQPTTAAPLFAGSLAPPAGGTSTGTSKFPSSSINYAVGHSIYSLSSPDSPFNFGGASSLATTPATGTPEPGAQSEDGQGKHADGDDAPQEQISLTDGGPGEEDEDVVHEVRAKAVKLVTGSKDEDGDGGDSGKDKKNPWKVQGVGRLRVLKHKTTGSTRMLLRAEPRGHVALNKLILPNFTYKPEATGGKYVKLTTSNDKGTGFETWMLQVKTKESAQALADALETNKGANKK